MFPDRNRISVEVFIWVEGGKPQNPEKNPQGRPTTNSTHIWRRARESNPGHSGDHWWRRASSLLRHPCTPILGLTTSTSFQKSSLWEISLNRKIFDWCGLNKGFEFIKWVIFSNHYLILKLDSFFEQNSVNFGPKLCRWRCYLTEPLGIGFTGRNKQH